MGGGGGGGQEFNIFLNTKTSTATSAVVSGVIEQEHTTDGEHFIGGAPFLCPAQDIGLLPDGEFALVGQCAKGNQIDLSKDGKVYSSHLIPTDVLNQTTDLVRCVIVCVALFSRPFLRQRSPLQQAPAQA